MKWRLTEKCFQYIWSMYSVKQALQRNRRSTEQGAGTGHLTTYVKDPIY